jgi:DNA primase
VFSEKKADTHILVLPAGHDPDSFIFEYGPQAFLKAASESPGIITFLMDCAVREHGLTTEGKIRIISALQEPLAAINDQVAQAVYIQQLAERIGIAESTILERIRAVAIRHNQRTADAGRQDGPGGGKPANGTTVYGAATDGQPGVNAGIRFERRIIAMMLQYPDILPEINNLSVLKYFENSDLETIGNLVLKFNPTTADQVSEIITGIENEAQRTLVASLALEDESWNKKGCLRLLGKFVDTRQKFQNRDLLENQIRAAEKSNDHALLLTLLNKKQKMAERSEKQKMAILNEK